jgi:hypothetical protein
LKEQLKMGMTEREQGAGKSIWTGPGREGWRTLHNSYSPNIITIKSNQDAKVWTGFTWLKMGAKCRLLSI